MNRAIDYLTWSLIVFATIVAGIVFFYIRTLQQHVDELRTEEAMLKSNLAIVQMALTDDDAFAQQIVTSLIQPCTQVQAAESDPRTPENTRTAILNLCGSQKANSGQWQQSLKFFPIYNNAVMQRISGKDFGKTAEAYSNALSTGNCASTKPTIPVRWCVRAYEGLAYAATRSRDFKAAQSALDSADKMDPDFVFADTTRIKLLCLSKAQQGTVTRSLEKLRQKFDALVKKYQTTNGELECYAAQDRATIENDAEMFSICHAYGISPMGNVDALATGRTCN